MAHTRKLLYPQINNNKDIGSKVSLIEGIQETGTTPETGNQNII